MIHREVAEDSEDSNSSNEVVFGSFLVDTNSQTPYTDATQVR